MARTSKSGIYIRHDEESGTFYVGQSKNVDNRDAHGKGHLLETFVAPEDTHMRRMTETELIQYCAAAGLPLSNIHQLKEPFVGIELDEEYG
jgi:hypothetical protein